MSKKNLTGKKSKKKAKKKRSTRSHSKKGVYHTTILPSVLHDKTVQQRLQKLKQEDPLFLDKEGLTKDNGQFISLAKSLKKLMVRKKRW
ncbi:hypothetical protein HYS47_01915 [Candidatus Woesearchaeota archaeon]|nr:hypothetical protein [Candidatus Woesearchaeota archaeon]